MTTTVEVLIIGAGFSGIGAAIKLKQAGIDCLVLEKAAEIGGVWRANTYPGCACDVPSSLYSYSFAPKPNWSRVFASQPEIKQYITDTATHFGVLEAVLLNHEMLESRWLEDSREWQVTTSQGEFRARFVIVAGGPMHKPAIPAIPGLDNFGGSRFHSSQWNHEVDLAGQRVAVIGTGASAIQFVPAIQPKVAQMTVFQRTPHWVLPKFDKPVSKKMQRWLARVPLFQKLVRGLFYGVFEFLNTGFRHPALLKKLQHRAVGNIYRTVKDPALRQRLTPDYTLGCKRILQSNDWYRALVKDNVTVTGGVSRIEGSSIIDVDGNAHEADVLVFATGFEIASVPISDNIIGESGKTLAEVWAGSPQGYHGTVIPDCPNLFLMFGPNLAISSSAFIIIEAQLGYITDALKKARQQNIRRIAARDDRTADYNRKIQTALQRTVYNNGGCASYFIDSNGRNSTAWPWSTYKMRRTLSRFRPADYEISH